MRSLLLLFLLVLCGINSNAQDTLNYTDANGKKQGHWIYYGKDRPELGYPEDGKVEEGTYVDNRKEGIWTKYYGDDKTPKLQGTYKNNRPNGPYKKFSADGTLAEEGTFERSKQIDRSTLGRVRIETDCDWRSKGMTYDNGQVYDQYGNPIVPIVPDNSVGERDIQPIYVIDGTAKIGEPQMLLEIYPERGDTLLHCIGTAAQRIEPVVFKKSTMNTMRFSWMEIFAIINSGMEKCMNTMTMVFS